MFDSASQAMLRLRRVRLRVSNAFDSDSQAMLRLRRVRLQVLRTTDGFELSMTWRIAQEF